MTLDLPYKFSPRPYQLPIFKAYRDGIRRFVQVWHRRAGKEKTDINFVALRAMERVGAYWYVFPTYTQGKKILWEGRDKDGFLFLDHIPAALVKKKNDGELMLTLANGSTIQVIGSDKTDSIVGTNPVGIVFSEYSLQKPLVNELMRPILAENEGWAVYNFTPRGMNHAHDLYETARTNPETWYCSRLTVDDTKAIPLSVIDEERANGMSEEMVQQEFYCSFEAGNVGAYYGSQMRDAASRIVSVPWEPKCPVYTAWDLGIDDATAIGFFQVIGNEWRWIDYYENSGEGLAHYAKVLKEKPYAYERHFFPHDTAARELGTGKSREEVLQSLGIRPVIVKQQSVEDGIEAVRGEFPRFWFDADKCKPLTQALRSYHKEYDEDRKTYKTRPEHDWSSHPCDMVRYAVMGYQPTPKPSKTPVYREGEDYSYAGY